MFNFGEQLETGVFLWFNWTIAYHMEERLFAFPNIYGSYVYAIISRKMDLSHMD